MESRKGNFAQGQSPTLSSGLQQRSNSFNAANPRMFRANGLNQPFMLSPNNGNSSMDASRQTPTGQLPSPNGMSESTYHAINPNSFGMNLSI